MPHILRHWTGSPGDWAAVLAVAVVVGMVLWAWVEDRRANYVPGDWRDPLCKTPGELMGVYAFLTLVLFALAWAVGIITL